MIGWPANAYVGQKVVCVDSGTDAGCFWMPGESPTKSRIYTLAEIFVSPISFSINFKLEELVRDDTCVALGMAGYGAHRFRPLATRDSRAAASRIVEQLKRLTLTAPAKELVE